LFSFLFLVLVVLVFIIAYFRYYVYSVESLTHFIPVIFSRSKKHLCLEERTVYGGNQWLPDEKLLTFGRIFFTILETYRLY